MELGVADCQQLEYADAGFDVVSSSVGVIFAPGPRASPTSSPGDCRPGGRIGLTAWRRDSGIGPMFTTISAFMPAPPAGAGSPFQWGDEQYAETRLNDAFTLSFEELDTRHVAADGSEIRDIYKES